MCDNQQILNAVQSDDVAALEKFLQNKEVVCASFTTIQDLVAAAVTRHHPVILGLLVEWLLKLGSAGAHKSLKDMVQALSTNTPLVAMERQLDAAGDWESVKQRVERAIEHIADGRFVVVQDDWDRENEADIIMAAEKVTPEIMAIIIRETSGIVCVPMPAERANALQLPRMVLEKDSTEKHGTAFTVSVDFAGDSVSTGVSAADRCITARALASSASTAEHFVRPGHMFPLVARPGGVLERQGHTEAGVDICRLAGCQPIAVISEMTNEDGSMCRASQLGAFLERHGAVLLSVSDIRLYRQKTTL